MVGHVICGSTDKSDSTKGNIWSMVETFCLIDCWADGEIEADLSGTHRNRHVYEHGYLRSRGDCRMKINYPVPESKTTKQHIWTIKLIPL